MERVNKKDILIYDGKSDNVATIKRASIRLLIPAAFLMVLGISLLFMSICDIANQYISKGVCDKWTLLIFAIIFIVASVTILIVKAILTKDPNIYFVSDKMYIKESKGVYLEIQPNEIESYCWKPFSIRNNPNSNTNPTAISDANSNIQIRPSFRYAVCSYWGNLSLVINGMTYIFSCSSMEKTKHYLDGFLNGVTVRENHMRGNTIQKLHTSAYLTSLFVVCFMFLFGRMMFNSANSVVSIISVVAFAVSVLITIILVILYFVKFKDIRQLEIQHYKTFVEMSPVILKNTGENDETQDDNSKDSDII